MFWDLSTYPWRSSFLVHKLKLTIASGQQDCRLCKQKRMCIHQSKQALAPGAKARWIMAHSSNLQIGCACSRHFASRDTRCRGDFHQNLRKEISRSDILWQWIWIHILDLMTSLSLSHWLLRQLRSTWAPTGGLRILNSPKDANQGKRLPDVSICACVLLVLNQNAYFVWGRILLLNPLLFCLYTHQSYFTSQTEKRYHVNSGSISCSKHLVRCPGHCMTMNILYIVKFLPAGL